VPFPLGLHAPPLLLLRRSVLPLLQQLGPLLELLRVDLQGLELVVNLFPLLPRQHGVAMADEVVGGLENKMNYYFHTAVIYLGLTFRHFMIKLLIYGLSNLKTRLVTRFIRSRQPVFSRLHGLISPGERLFWLHGLTMLDR